MNHTDNVGKLFWLKYGHMNYWALVMVYGVHQRRDEWEYHLRSGIKGWWHDSFYIFANEFCEDIRKWNIVPADSSGDDPDEQKKKKEISNKVVDEIRKTL